MTDPNNQSNTAKRVATDSEGFARRLSVLTSHSCRVRSSNRCCSSHEGYRTSAMTSDRAPESQKVFHSLFTLGRLLATVNHMQTHAGWIHLFCEVKWVFLTSRSDAVSLEWYAQRPAYRGLRSCSTINNRYIYFTSLEYLGRQNKLEEKVRIEKAGDQFNLKTTGAPKQTRFIMSVRLWELDLLHNICWPTETQHKWTLLGSIFILRSLSLRGSSVSNTLTLYFAYIVDPRKQNCVTTN